MTLHFSISHISCLGFFPIQLLSRSSRLIDDSFSISPVPVWYIYTSNSPTVQLTSFSNCSSLVPTAQVVSYLLQVFSGLCTSITPPRIKEKGISVQHCHIFHLRPHKSAPQPIYVQRLLQPQHPNINQLDHLLSKGLINPSLTILAVTPTFSRRPHNPLQLTTMSTKTTISSHPNHQALPIPNSKMVRFPTFRDTPKTACAADSLRLILAKSQSHPNFPSSDSISTQSESRRSSSQSTTASSTSSGSADGRSASASLASSGSSGRGSLTGGASKGKGKGTGKVDEKRASV